MADTSGVNPFIYACQGGLILDQTPFSQQPGTATELENFEPSVTGGYRRVSGYQKWNTNIVPQDSSSSEPVLLSAYFRGSVIAARGGNCLLYTSPSPRDGLLSRMPSSA